MKIFRKQSSHFKLIVLLCLVTVARLSAQFQIVGPASILPDGSSGPNFDNLFFVNDPQHFGMFNTFWSVNSPNTKATSGGSVGECFLSSNFQETNCTVVLTCSIISNASPGHTFVVTKSVRILPYIAASDPNVYVGQVAQFYIQNNCTNNTGCNYNWSVAAANLCVSPCTSSSSSFLVTCPATNYPSTWQLDCQMSCSNLPSMALKTRKDFIKLGPINSITGYPTIGCSWAPAVTYPLIYSIPAVIGATSYNWVVPAFMNITQGQGTNQIIVDANNTGLGIITVQAVGNAVKSDIIKKNVQVCCIPFMLLNSSNDVNAPNSDSREAGQWIHAENTINSGAAAKYHAQFEVKLNPGFKSLSGSLFHAYIANCGSGYYRMINDEYENGTEQTSEINDEVLTALNLPENSELFSPEILPNPSSGIFTILLGRNAEYPESIRVIDIMGKVINENTALYSYDQKLDLSTEKDGMYLVKINYKNRIVTKRIVKSQ